MYHKYVIDNHRTELPHVTEKKVKMESSSNVFWLFIKKVFSNFSGYVEIFSSDDIQVW